VLALTLITGLGGAGWYLHRKEQRERERTMDQQNQHHAISNNPHRRNMASTGHAGRSSQSMEEHDEFRRVMSIPAQRANANASGDPARFPSIPLPITIWSAQEHAVLVTQESTIAPATTACSICLNELHEGDHAFVTPHCRHVFHNKCMEGWINHHTFHARGGRHCPNCRTQVIVIE
jgi:hypothetical protein